MTLPNIAIDYIPALSLTVGPAVIAALAALHWARVWAGAKRRQIQLETQRNVMAAVMDSQNNFLNNIVYFHARAESGGFMTSQELSEMDAVIRRAQDRLIEIAESEPPQTNPLDGKSRAVQTAKPRLAG